MSLQTALLRMGAWISSVFQLHLDGGRVHPHHTLREPFADVLDAHLCGGGEEDGICGEVVD